MVVNEWPIFETVFVVEATANLSLYVDSIRTNYVIPTLEYLAGGPPDERDYGFDNSYICSLYSLVTFTTAESAPDLASLCYGPTSSTFKLLQWFDRIQFIGGGGSSCSHVTEGVATALQCFDEFKAMRESSAGLNISNITKHCILICNSPPYCLPATESVTYNGCMVDQLVTIMGERGINLSVISPRKMQFLLKLYEKAGSDLQQAMSKNYAKDRRHLVLLKGYQLTERPLSPQSQAPQPKIDAVKLSPSPHQGTKRPLSPASSGPPTPVSNVTSVSSVPVNQLRGAPPPPTFVQPGKAPTPDSIVRPSRGASPVPRWNSTISGTSTPPISSTSPGPNPMPVLTSQLQMPSIRSGSPAQALVPQTQTQSRLAFTNTQIRPIRGSFAPASSPSAMGSSPISRASVPSPLSQNVASPMPLSGGSGMNVNEMTPQQLNGLMAHISQDPMMKDRKQVWLGIIEFQEKTSPQNASNRLVHSLPCYISCPNKPDSEINSEKWPSKLSLQLLPRYVMTKLFSILKQRCHQVTLHFSNQQSEGYLRLSKLVSTTNGSGGACVGYIYIPPPAAVRVMLILHLPEKKVYSGFVPLDQDGFFNEMRNAVEQFKKEGKQKQMLMPNAAGQVVSSSSGVNQNMMSQNIGGQMVHQAMQPPPGMTPLQQVIPNATFYQIQQIPVSGVNQQPVSTQSGQSTIPSTTLNANFNNSSVNGIRISNVSNIINQGGGQGMINQTSGPQQQANVLLNQALGPISGPASGLNASLNQTQISAPVASPLPSQPQYQQSQFTTATVNSHTIPTQISNLNPQPERPVTPLEVSERKKNLIKIQKLQQSLEAARQKELQFQQQQVDQFIPVSDGQSNSGGIVQQQPQQQPPQPQVNQQQPLNNMVRQQFIQGSSEHRNFPQPSTRQQLQQHIQQQQQQQRLQLLQQQGGNAQQTTNTTLRMVADEKQQVIGQTQLRHLLQQQQAQQMRGPAPGGQTHVLLQFNSDTSNQQPPSSLQQQQIRLQHPQQIILQQPQNQTTQEWQPAYN